MFEYENDMLKLQFENSEDEFENQWFAVNGDLDDFIFYGDDASGLSER